MSGPKDMALDAVGLASALLRDARLLNGFGERNGKGLMRGDAVKAARVVEAHAERLEPEGPVLVRRLARELSPQAVGADLESLPGKQDLVIADDQHAADTRHPDQVRPVPRDPVA